MIFRGLESSGTGTLTYFRLTLFSDEIVAFATYLCFIVRFENVRQGLILIFKIKILVTCKKIYFVEYNIKNLIYFTNCKLLRGQHTTKLLSHCSLLKASSREKVLQLNSTFSELFFLYLETSLEFFLGVKD